MSKYFARFSREKKEWIIYKTIYFIFPVGEEVHERFNIGDENRFKYFEKYIENELERLNDE